MAFISPDNVAGNPALAKQKVAHAQKPLKKPTMSPLPSQNNPQSVLAHLQNLQQHAIETNIKLDHLFRKGLETRNRSSAKAIFTQAMRAAMRLSKRTEQLTEKCIAEVDAGGFGAKLSIHAKNVTPVTKGLGRAIPIVSTGLVITGVLWAVFDAHHKENQAHRVALLSQAKEHRVAFETLHKENGAQRKENDAQRKENKGFLAALQSTPGQLLFQQLTTANSPKSSPGKPGTSEERPPFLGQSHSATSTQTQNKPDHE